MAEPLPKLELCTNADEGCDPERPRRSEIAHRRGTVGLEALGSFASAATMPDLKDAEPDDQECDEGYETPNE